MTEVTATVGAHDLGPGHAESTVGVPCHGARHCVEEGWPSATRLEFMGGLVEGRIASSAGVDAVRWHVLVVLAGVGCLRSFVTENAELLLT